jgi:hypothetical protein
LDVDVQHVKFSPLTPNSFCCICGKEELTNYILILMPEIRIKFGCRQRSARHVEGLYQAMEKRSFCLCMERIPNVCETKLKDGLFVGRQIKKLFEKHGYSTKLILQKEENGRHFATSAEAS